MTQEEKQLLLKDICARQPYKVKISVDDDNLFIPTLKYIDRITCHFYECAWTEYIDNIKPYLRPISSMTEEEFDELSDIIIPVDDGKAIVEEENSHKYVDFCNAHHFDYRGLIEKGLALEAPDGMYNTKTE